MDKEKFNAFVKRLWKANHSDAIAKILQEYHEQMVSGSSQVSELEQENKNLHELIESCDQTKTAILKKLNSKKALTDELASSAGVLITQMSPGEKDKYFIQCKHLIEALEKYKQSKPQE